MFGVRLQEMIVCYCLLPLYLEIQERRNPAWINVLEKACQRELNRANESAKHFNQGRDSPQLLNVQIDMFIWELHKYFKLLFLLLTPSVFQNPWWLSRRDLRIILDSSIPFTSILHSLSLVPSNTSQHIFSLFHMTPF